jgi:hypothetical protein
MGTKRVGLARTQTLMQTLNRALNLKGSTIAFRKPASAPEGTSTQLTANDTGGVFFMDASSANTITLPAISDLANFPGWHVKVILTATGNTGIVQTSSTEDKIMGQVNVVDADGSAQAVTNDADADTITFVNGCLAGAWVDIHADGELFYVHGFGTHATASNKLTLTKAD